MVAVQVSGETLINKYKQSRAILQPLEQGWKRQLHIAGFSSVYRQVWDYISRLITSISQHCQDVAVTRCQHICHFSSPSYSICAEAILCSIFSQTTVHHGSVPVPPQEDTRVINVLRDNCSTSFQGGEAALTCGCSVCNVGNNFHRGEGGCLGQIRWTSGCSLSPLVRHRLCVILSKWEYIQD